VIRGEPVVTGFVAGPRHAAAALIADGQHRARQLQSRSYKRGRAAIPAQVRNAGTARLERERKEPV
jgi:hypothetical protein